MLPWEAKVVIQDEFIIVGSTPCSLGSCMRQSSGKRKKIFEHNDEFLKLSLMRRRI
jgi:hypothetical protein